MARMQVLVAALSATAAAAAATPSLLFVGRDLTKNDFYAAAAAYPTRQKYATIDAALAAAKPRDGLMLCADGILPAATQPQTNTTVAVTARQWSKAAALQLRVYLEFPRSLPPSDGTALPVAQTLWERAVVTQDLGPALPKMELLHPHKHVDFVKLPASWLPRSLIVIAKVAGYDKAELGLPPANVTWPMLTMQSDTLLVASTQLSHCRTRRFAPSEQWMAVAAHVLTWATNGSWHAPKAPCSPPQPCPPPPPLWTPSVTASFSATEKLPPDAELQALVRGVQFYRNARLIPDATRATALARLHCKSADSSNNCSDFANLRAPYAQRLSGEGQLGIFEGLTSDIDLLGRQPQSIGVRADCVTESSASFAVRGRVTKNSSDLLVGTNLLSYAHIHAGYTQPWIVGAGAETDASRPWTASGDAFGLLSWTTADAAYELYYKDDDARGMLGAIATASLVQSDRWHTTLVTAILGNLRTTPKNGFGPLSGGFSTMVSELGPGHDGWRAVYDSAGGHPSFSPHYSSYIWAVHLWAYSRCGFAPLLERPMAALKIMMTNYPTKWVPTSNGIAMQRARIILPLAFLVRANDTALHREWLNTAVSGFMTRRNCTKTATAHWCAYKEELSHPGWGGSTRVPDNANYGTFEAPLNQHNDDPVSDFLYTSNFALLGLHEAAAATGNATIEAEEDALAEFIVRIQAKSTEHTVDGAWQRAFDFVKWEAWASDADIGWGAWSVESGWTQSWITITLGMRLLNTSLWELGGSIKGIEADFATWIPVLFPPPPPPPPPPPCLPKAQHVQGKAVSFKLAIASSGAATALCCCEKGKTTASIAYTGTLCPDGKSIEWTGARNPEPRGDKTPQECSWSRGADPADIPGFFGSCGVAATAVPLPVAVCT